MKSNVFIYVMTERWIIVGRVAEVQSDPLFITLQDCAVVRTWGTSKGLGQLAREGPLTGTILDNEPSGSLIRLTDCKRIIPCNVKAWSKWKSE